MPGRKPCYLIDTQIAQTVQNSNRLKGVRAIFSWSQDAVGSRLRFTLAQEMYICQGSSCSELGLPNSMNVRDNQIRVVHGPVEGYLPNGDLTDPGMKYGYSISGHQAPQAHYLESSPTLSAGDSGAYFSQKTSDWKDKNKLFTKFSQGETPQIAYTQRSHQFSTSSLAADLKDPLFYVAKYGGFTKKDDNLLPDKHKEWDKNQDGKPDNLIQADKIGSLSKTMDQLFKTIAEKDLTDSKRLISSEISKPQFIYSKALDGYFSIRAPYEKSDTWSGDLKVSFKPKKAKGHSKFTWSAQKKLQQKDKSTRKIISWDHRSKTGFDFKKEQTPAKVKKRFTKSAEL